MIALAAQIALFTEALIYAALGWYLAGHGWSLPGIIAVCLGVALGVRLLVTLIPFTVVVFHRIQEKRWPVWRDFALAFAKEAWAKSLSFTWVQPFEHWLMTPDPEPAKGGAVPVLLVHGYVCNRGIWLAMRNLLTQRMDNPVFTLNLEPPLAAIDEYVDQLAARVEEICMGSGHDRIYLVCHSMGGLVARHWMARRGGADFVVKMITLASPHHGTQLARFGIGHNVKQMRYGNEWLASLAEAEMAAARGAAVVSIGTENDNLVYPPESSDLPGAKNVRLKGVGHVSLQFSPEAADLIASEIKSQS
jgi:triacylglycerol lipase